MLHTVLHVCRMYSTRTINRIANATLSFISLSLSYMYTLENYR